MATRHVTIGSVEAWGDTPAERRAYYLRQFERSLDAGKADEVGVLSAQITRLCLRIAELSARRDDLCQQVWGCDYAGLE